MQVALPKFEMQRLALDVKKTFDKVRHDDLIYKIRLLGINPTLCRLVANFLKVVGENWNIFLCQGNS